MKILLTAFEPFGGESVNPAMEAVKLVRDEISGAVIVKRYIPVVFGKSIAAVLTAMEEERPDAVVCVGQAGGREGVTPERVAINVDDARIPDNEGNRPIDAPVYADGENAYFASIPVKAIVRRIQEAGIPSSLSNSAGTYVCNHLMYGVLYNIERSFPGMRGGFIHVPYIPEQVAERPGVPSMPLSDIVTALEAALAAIAENERDIPAALGTEN